MKYFVCMERSPPEMKRGRCVTENISLLTSPITVDTRRRKTGEIEKERGRERERERERKRERAGGGQLIFTTSEFKWNI